MYTKGEWTIKDSFEGLCTDIVCGEKRICEVKHYSKDKNDPNDSEGLSNAKLICAAPDMLDALLSLENDNDSIPKHIWQLVQNAINKAIKQ